MEQNILLKSSPWDKDNLKRSPEKTKKEPQGRVGGTKTKLMQAWSTISLKARRVFTCQGHMDEKHVDYIIHIKGQNIFTVRYSFASWGFQWDWTGGWLFQLVQPCQGGCSASRWLQPCTVQPCRRCIIWTNIWFSNSFARATKKSGLFKAFFRSKMPNRPLSTSQKKYTLPNTNTIAFYCESWIWSSLIGHFIISINRSLLF